MNVWFVNTDTGTIEHNLETLRIELEKGALRRHNLVWRQGMHGWTRLDQEPLLRRLLPNLLHSTLPLPYLPDPGRVPTADESLDEKTIVRTMMFTIRDGSISDSTASTDLLDEPPEDSPQPHPVAAATHIRVSVAALTRRIAGSEQRLGAMVGVLSLAGILAFFGLLTPRQGDARAMATPAQHQMLEAVRSAEPPRLRPSNFDPAASPETSRTAEPELNATFGTRHPKSKVDSASAVPKTSTIGKGSVRISRRVVDGALATPRRSIAQPTLDPANEATVPNPGGVDRRGWMRPGF